MLADEASANKAFDDALAIVNEDTSLRSRLQLSFEAKRLGREDSTVDLLRGRVATDRESDALHVLIAAAMSSHRWVTAREILTSISPEVQSRDWFKKAEAILAINTGDITADEKIARYLEKCANDVEMILARIGIWQRSGREGDIRSFLNRIELPKLEGLPELRIRIAACVVHYSDPARGLRYGYKILLENWDLPEAHLSYQGLIFLNENIGAAMPEANAVAENTVVGLEIEGHERRYRIEKERYPVFGNERLEHKDDLAGLLLGKKEGETFNLQDGIGAKSATVRWIKPIYLDAFHCSLEQFNERFPRADGLMRFSFDPDAADPLADIRAITKARAEADQRILDEYRSKSIPLSFVAALVGKNPLDAWSGLPSVGIKFQVCRGTLPEREEAVRAIKQHGGKGCVLDAITLSIVRRLGLEKAVSAVCGPLNTTQSVIELFAFRAFEAQGSVGKKQGYIGWRNNRIVVEEFSEELLKKAAEECAKELSWVRGTVAIVPAMPKKDFSESTQTLTNIIGQKVFDPAIAADGNGLLLLSRKTWAFECGQAATFQNAATWLQPVLIAARAEGKSQ